MALFFSELPGSIASFLDEALVPSSMPSFDSNEFVVCSSTFVNSLPIPSSCISPMGVHLYSIKCSNKPVEQNCSFRGCNAYAAVVGVVAAIDMLDTAQALNAVVNNFLLELHTLSFVRSWCVDTVWLCSNTKVAVVALCAMKISGVDFASSSIRNGWACCRCTRKEEQGPIIPRDQNVTASTSKCFGNILWLMRGLDVFKYLY